MLKIKEIREKRGISQSELSNISGVPLTMVRAYDRGGRDINKAQVGTVRKLARALKCRIEDLLEE